MNKLLKFGILCCAVVAMASCSSDEPSKQSINQPSQRGHFTILLPQAATRAYLGENASADKLVWALYDNNGKLLSTETINEGAFANGTQEVDVQMLDDENYSLVFFASNSKGNACNFDTKDGLLIVDYEHMNPETDDVFYCTLKGTPGDMNSEVKLNRPFAQINIGTDDAQTGVVTAGGGLENFSHTLTLSGDVLAKMSLLNTATVTKVDSPLTFDLGKMAVCTGEGIEFPVSGYQGVNMQYVLVALGNENISITYKILKGEQEYRTYQLDNAPVAPNHRTNLYGSLLTTSKTLSVSINGSFGQDDTANELSPAE